jgi:Ca2+-binding EF-hand superfamily protein
MLVKNRLQKNHKKPIEKKVSSQSRHSQRQNDLTIEQKQEVRAAFDLFDSDGSGYAHT